MAGSARAPKGKNRRQAKVNLAVEPLEDRVVPSFFPSTASTIGVFEDQLPSLDSALTQFIATHTDGTQKQTLAEINAFRAYNPNYTLLDYRLGTMAGPPDYIINGQWASDWSTVNSNESWFAHQTDSGEPQSASDLASGRIIDTPDQSNAMDISNTSWQNYWLTTELQDMGAVQANGVFADSFTYGIGGAGYDSPPLRFQGTNAANPADWPGGVPFVGPAGTSSLLGNWAQTIETTFQQYNTAHGTDYMFIPNLDARVTSWEPNWVDNSSGVPIMDGAFLEGFGQWTDTYDWTLSMNRGLNFTDNNKVVIMQPYFNGSPDSTTGQQERNFYMGTYLLLKGNETYINMDYNGGAEYFPEYQLNLGAPTTPLPSNVSSYLWNGVYRRDFQNGFVLVNPGTTSYTLNLGGTYQLVQGTGGGAMSDSSLDASGNYIGGSLTYTNMSSITLAGGTAAIFMNPASSGPTVATAASASTNPVLGTSVNLSVLGQENGSDTGLTYTWTNSGPASVSYSANATNAAKNTTATFSQAGSYTFTATITDSSSHSVTSSIVVTVDQTLKSIKVSPSSSNVADGGTQQFSATGYDQFGNALSTQPTFTWSVSSGSGTVSSSGLYTAPTTGSASATVKATSGTISATASVNYAAPTLTVATAATASANPVTGKSVNLSVLGQENGSDSGLTYTWSSSGPASVGFSANGTNAAKSSTATFTQAGTYTFTATIADTHGQSLTSSIVVTVNQTLTSIAVTPGTITIADGTTWQFSAAGTDQFGNPVTLSGLTWSVAAGAGTINSTGVYSAPATGNSSATLRATSGTVSGNATVSYEAPTPSIASPAAATPNPVTGTTVGLSVLGSENGSDTVLTYTWSSSGPASVSFSANGTNAAKNTTATFSQAGTYNFTAKITDPSNQSVTSSVVVTVNQKLTSIAVSPATVTLADGSTQQFSATALDQFGKALTTRPAFTWTGSGSGTLSTTGLYTAPASGTSSATVTAANSSISGSATVTITATASTWTSVPGMVSQVVSARASNGDLELFGIGGDHAVYVSSETSPGGTFSNWQDLGGYVTQITVGTNSNGTLTVFAIGGDHGAWFRKETSPGSFGSWTPLGGYVTQITVARDTAGDLQLFAIGGDNGVWVNRQTAANSTSFGGWAGLGGYVTQIAVGTNSDGTLMVFGIGGDHGAWFRKETSPGTFSGWSSLGGYVTQLAVGLDKNGDLELFAIGGDNAVWYRVQSAPNSTSFSGWNSLGGYVTQIAMGTNADGTLSVFGVGGDQSAWYRRQSSTLTFSTWSPLGESVIQLATANEQSQELTLFAVGSDNIPWYIRL